MKLYQSLLLQLFLCIPSVYGLTPKKSTPMSSHKDTSPNFKVIGLMQVKNEEDIIEYSLRALALHTDEIIILDDGSDDGTVTKLSQLAKELHISEIIFNQQSEWIHGSEVTNRQKLLDAGRRHGGTHFLELDADEIFTTHCAENNWLRNKLASLKKGQILQIPIVNLWKGFEYYRSKFTDSFPDICYCTIGYCDDGTSDLSHNLKNSHPGFLHFGRFPHKKPDNYDLFVYEPNINHSIIHMPFINWQNVIIKKIWIIMLEITRLQEHLYNKEKYPNGRTIEDISLFYETFHNYDDENIEFAETPHSWLNYSFMQKEPFISKLAYNKLDDIKMWIKQYGKEFFCQCPYIKKHINTFLDPLKVCIAGHAPEIYYALKNELEKYNCQVQSLEEINSQTGGDYLNCDIVFTININPSISNRIEKHNQNTTTPIKLYAIVLEPPHVEWQSYNLLFYKKYDLIFTLDDSLHRHPYLNKYVKINFPQRSIKLLHNPVPFHKRKLLTIVNSYKTGTSDSPTYEYDLYKERFNLINYFNNQGECFDFYGQQWENGPYHTYRSFRGSLCDKISTLQQYKFIVCFENSCIIPGYITEKIFDSFISGTVPIYWGAPNVENYIPKNCFIDMNDFNNYEALHSYLENMSEETYNNYLYAIASFLNSEKASQFLNTHVSQAITQQIFNSVA